jgi:hypothetical protein
LIPYLERPTLNTSSLLRERPWLEARSYDSAEEFYAYIVATILYLQNHRVEIPPYSNKEQEEVEWMVRLIQGLIYNEMLNATGRQLKDRFELMKQNSKLKQAGSAKPITVTFIYSENEDDVESLVVVSDDPNTAEKKAFSTRSDKRIPKTIEIHDPLLNPDFVSYYPSREEPDI